MDRLKRARVLLAEAAALGVTIEDLVAESSGSPEGPSVAPTIAEYVETVGASFSKGTADTYKLYWRLAVTCFGGRPIDAIGVDDCESIVADAVERARRSRPGTDGRSARENCIGALRALFARAERAGLVAKSPAADLEKPRRLPNRRRALEDDELREVIDAVRTTSQDPDLDLLLIRFHLESGARREGALNLSLRDLDGRRITRRRYNTVFDRARPCLPWAERTSVSAHILRHTAITAVERHAGFAVAQAFAGHSATSVTGTYTRARLGEVAAAVAALTGEAHPLAEQ